MRIPLRWLGEFVELPDSITPEDVHHSLVSIGLEEEAIHRSEISGPIVVGEVLEFVARNKAMARQFGGVRFGWPTKTPPMPRPFAGSSVERAILSRVIVWSSPFLAPYCQGLFPLPREKPMGIFLMA